MYFTSEERDSIIRDYQNGMRPCELGDKYHRNDASIINMLKSKGVFTPSRNRWSRGEISWLKENYAYASLDEVRSRFPNRSINDIHGKASELRLSRDGYHWSPEEVKLLEENYLKYDANVLAEMLGGRYTTTAIKCKANKIGLKKDVCLWTEEEDRIIREYYPKMFAKDFVKYLPGRTVNGIVIRAQKLGVPSYFYSQVTFSEKECEYIKSHWAKCSDEQMAEVLKRTKRSVKDVRNRLGLHRKNDDYTCYSCFDKLFRGQISGWKQESMKQCNYQCVLTHSKSFQVHHLINFKTILNEAYSIMEEAGMLKSSNIEDYSKDEIEQMIDLFKTVHSTYPLGVCVRKDLHDLFHTIYGRWGNTEQQWNQFVADYKNGIYKQ